MARSDYIYVVHDVIGLTKIAATFTVKKELVRWLRGQGDEDGDIFFLEVFRCRDNGWAFPPVKLDIKELLNG